MSTVVLHNVVSVDGYIAVRTTSRPALRLVLQRRPSARRRRDGRAGAGRDEGLEGVLRLHPSDVDAIGSMVIGRHLFDMT